MMCSVVIMAKGKVYIDAIVIFIPRYHFSSITPLNSHPFSTSTVHYYPKSSTLNGSFVVTDNKQLPSRKASNSQYSLTATENLREIGTFTVADEPVMFKDLWDQEQFKKDLEIVVNQYPFEALKLWQISIILIQGCRRRKCLCENLKVYAIIHIFGWRLLFLNMPSRYNLSHLLTPLMNVYAFSRRVWSDMNLYVAIIYSNHLFTCNH
ncbi:unnamed protein product [Vicia faba]|uniref:Uncharacterized protein n=1 Tax=Vicia faba TaxID=3906 RepID=A0AAV0Z5X5_VICFA|nr:unnamed protein product [Vicia faba]